MSAGSIKDGMKSIIRWLKNSKNTERNSVQSPPDRPGEKLDFASAAFILKNK
jgi:hypothetical protein